MSDEVDMAAEKELAHREEAIRANAHALPPGAPGECKMCGEYSLRLVFNACAPCRDKYRLP